MRRGVFYRRPELASVPCVRPSSGYYDMYSLRPRRAAKMRDEAPLTITVPEAGKRDFNLSRDASYAAAQRGDIPTIRVGRLLRVPVKAMERLLDEPRQQR